MSGPGARKENENPDGPVREAVVELVAVSKTHATVLYPKFVWGGRPRSRRTPWSGSAIATKDRRGRRSRVLGDSAPDGTSFSGRA